MHKLVINKLYIMRIFALNDTEDIYRYLPNANINILHFLSHFHVIFTHDNLIP